MGVVSVLQDRFLSRNDQVIDRADMRAELNRSETAVFVQRTPLSSRYMTLTQRGERRAR